MPLFGFEETDVALSDSRVMYIGGHPGSYKTSLAFRIAWYLYKHDRIDRVISNTSCVWNENLRRLVIDDPRTLRAAIILDEGGIFLKSNAKADQFLAFLRKVDSYVIVPSVKGVPANVNFITIKADMKLTRIGIPLVRYRTWVDRKKFSKFWWYRPSEIFGIYDTSAAVIDANDIANFLSPLQDRLLEIRKLEAEEMYQEDDDENYDEITVTPEEPHQKNKESKKLREFVVEPDTGKYNSLERKIEELIDHMRDSDGEPENELGLYE